MEFLHRLLDLVRRELSASDARVEIGGRDPDDPRLIWTKLPQGWRIVAVLDAPPTDRAAAQEKLEALVGAFETTATQSATERPRPVTDTVAHVLDDELARLARRAGAAHAVIVDHTTPVVWASSELARGEDEDVDLLEETAAADSRAREAGVDLAEVAARTTEDAAAWLGERGISEESADELLRVARRMRDVAPDRQPAAWRKHVLLARAVTEVRRRGPNEHRLAHQDGGFGYLARTLGDIYRLVLAFEGPFSELHAEAAAVHALHYLERLLAALPPRDPGSAGGRRGANVIRFPRR